MSLIGDPLIECSDLLERAGREASPGMWSAITERDRKGVETAQQPL
jgi:hypothetical protein